MSGTLPNVSLESPPPDLLIYTSLLMVGISLYTPFDIIKQIYAHTQDTFLLSYAMEAVLDTGFSLPIMIRCFTKFYHSFRHLPLNRPHVHALTCLLMTLSDPSLTVPLLTSLVPHEKLLAYQFAFDLVEGDRKSVV